jgi:hypothetical protein
MTRFERWKQTGYDPESGVNPPHRVPYEEPHIRPAEMSLEEAAESGCGQCTGEWLAALDYGAISSSDRAALKRGDEMVMERYRGR